MRCPNCETDIFAADTALAQNVEKQSEGRLTLYGIFGQRVFPIYGASGGITAQFVFYVMETVTRKAPPSQIEDARAMMPVRIMQPPESDSAERIAAICVERFDKLAHLLKEGDDLGLEGLDLRFV